jgi:hypothetical protein
VAVTVVDRVVLEFPEVGLFVCAGRTAFCLLMGLVHRDADRRQLYLRKGQEEEASGGLGVDADVEAL